MVIFLRTHFQICNLGGERYPSAPSWPIKQRNLTIFQEKQAKFEQPTVSYPLVKAGKNSTLVLSCDAQAKRLHANPAQLVRRRSELSPEHFFR